MNKMIFAAALLTIAWTASADKAKLKPPAEGRIKVAFVMTEGATMIDFAGPWEVFQDVMIGEGDDHQMPFELFTVGASREPIRTSAGMKVIPDYTFEDAPQPHIVVVGAQRGAPALTGWLQKVAPKADVMMSVCTGAFKFGDAGLLDGKDATTHHDFYEPFAKRFPKVKLVKSTRFVQSDAKTFTAGGLTSGIDLALHIVDAYFGRETAQRTATYMEYESTSWKR
jgi:transcriptional regulator GlxA family with amidase domain